MVDDFFCGGKIFPELFFYVFKVVGRYFGMDCKYFTVLSNVNNLIENINEIFKSTNRLQQSFVVL